jgi:hypothetical protein
MWNMTVLRAGGIPANLFGCGNSKMAGLAVPAFGKRFARIQAKGLVQSSPGQRSGFAVGFILLQATGLLHCGVR